MIPNTLRAAPAFSLHRENVTTPDAAVPNSRREGVNTADFPRTVVEAQAVQCEAALVFHLWNDVFEDFVPLTPEVRFGPGRTSRVVATDGRMLFVQVKSLTPTGPMPRVDVAVAGLITDGPSERDRVTLSDVTFTGDVQVNLDHANDDVLAYQADADGVHRPARCDADGRAVVRTHTDLHRTTHALAAGQQLDGTAGRGLFTAPVAGHEWEARRVTLKMGRESGKTWEIAVREGDGAEVVVLSGTTEGDVVIADPIPLLPDEAIVVRTVDATQPVRATAVAVVINPVEQASPPVVFAHDAEDGDGGFTVAGSPQTLWHRTRYRASTGQWSWYYGSGEVGVAGQPGAVAGNFVDGGSNEGSLLAPEIVLPAAGPLVLSFDFFLDTEGGTTWDRTYVEVLVGGVPVRAFDKNDLNVGMGTTGGVWKHFQADISALAGQTVRLRFRFNTGDSIANSTEGWYVDNVRIERVTNG